MDPKFYENAQRELENGSYKPDNSGPFATIVILVFIVGIFIIFRDVVKSKEEIVYTPVATIYIEAKNPLGSWFNQDDISFGDDEIVIHKNSLLGDESIILPYSKIDEVRLCKQMFGYKASFKYGKGFINSKVFNFYMKGHTTFEALKLDLKYHSGKLVVIESISLLNNLVE